MLQAGGAHGTPAVVVGRDERSRDVLTNVVALSAACARIMSDVATLFFSSVSNWIQAAVMVAPFGITRPLNRTPTVCTTVPSVTSSRSEDVRETEPPEDSSASSELTATRTSRTVGTAAAGVDGTVAAAIAASTTTAAGKPRLQIVTSPPVAFSGPDMPGSATSVAQSAEG